MRCESICILIFPSIRKDAHTHKHTQTHTNSHIHTGPVQKEEGASRGGGEDDWRTACFKIPLSSYLWNSWPENLCDLVLLNMNQTRFRHVALPISFCFQ